MLKLLLKKKLPPKPVSLRQHYERRHRILVKRLCGGFGDTLIARMMFEDFSNAFPGAEVTFSCPGHFIGMAENHPYCKAVVLGLVEDNYYGAVYDVSTACRVHESRHGPKNTSNRSDIWAAFCGVKLDNHDMHLKPQPEMVDQCNSALKYCNKENKPIVLLVTQSQHPQLAVGSDSFGMGKSISLNQIPGIVEGLRNRGYYVFAVHSDKIAELGHLGVDQFTNIHPQAWIAMVSLADYVITIDTATLHIAGGLKKPTVAVFTFTPSLPYTKYYPNMEPIQGPCPYGYKGCFTTFIHCRKNAEDPFPCQAGTVPSDILAGFDRLVRRFPLGKSPTSENVQKSRQIDLLAHTT